MNRRNQGVRDRRRRMTIEFCINARPHPRRADIRLIARLIKRAANAINLLRTFSPLRTHTREHAWISDTRERNCHYGHSFSFLSSPARFRSSIAKFADIIGHVLFSYDYDAYLHVSWSPFRNVIFYVRRPTRCRFRPVIPCNSFWLGIITIEVTYIVSHASEIVRFRKRGNIRGEIAFQDINRKREKERRKRRESTKISLLYL